MKIPFTRYFKGARIPNVFTLQSICRLSHSIRGDHAHSLKSLGKSTQHDLEKKLFAEAVGSNFSQYVSSGSLDEACPIKRVFINHLSANNPIEDRWNMGFIQVDGIVSSYLFTVLDGHGGTSCVHTLAWSILDYVAAAFLDTRKLHAALSHLRAHDVHQPYHLARRLDFYSASDHQRVGHPATPPTNQLVGYMRKCLREYMDDLVTRENRDMDPEHCLTESLLRLDNDLCSMGEKSDLIFNPERTQDPQLTRGLIRMAMSGAVGCVGRLFWSNQKKGKSPPELHLANVGDCGVVLLREVRSDSGDLILEPISCTKAHQGSSNPSELARITLAHPENRSTELFREGGRLFGELAPSRAFGNVRYKWPVDRLLDMPRVINQLSGSGRDASTGDISPLPFPYTSPPYLTAEPEVTRIELTPADRYIVMASDGLWDMLSLEDTAQVVQTDVDNPHCPATRLLRKGLTNILPAMTRNLGKRTGARVPASRKGEHLDKTALDQAFRQLSLPLGLARYYRDDITVVVIELFDPTSSSHPRQ